MTSIPPEQNRRVEDRRLLLGRGRYAGDMNSSAMLHLAVVRSTLARGRIVEIDTARAAALPGVVAVWTWADLPASARTMSDWLAPDLAHRARPVLAESEVRCVGDALAVVLAEDEYVAHDAVDLVGVVIDEVAASALPTAGRAHAPRPEAEVLELARRHNFEFGDVDGEFARAACVVRAHLGASRICGAAMEPRAAWAERVGERLTVRASTQSVFNVRAEIARRLGLEEQAVRVLAEDVGGGFGPKGTVYPEDVLVALAAWSSGRPVRWVASRIEDGMTTVHAHGTELDLELAADADGRLRALRGHILHDAGAYGTSGVNQPNNFVTHLISTYHLPALRIEADAMFTDTAPTGFVRGGGRPLGNFGIERMIDRLAHELELDPIEVRRRNLIQPHQMPHSTGLVLGGREMVYDSGDYPALLDAALDAVNGPGGRDQAQAGAGSVRGLGVACCVEQSGFGSGEPARIQITPDGVAHLHLGCTPQGQGHRTMAALLLAERLGWALDRVEVHLADTDVSAAGGLTAGSRSAMHVGNAVALAATTARSRILDLASAALEADARDLVLEAGAVSVRGVPAMRVEVGQLVPAGGLSIEERWDAPNPSAYSSACHAALVEVDTATGLVTVLRYAIAYDVGRVLNPLTATGQLHGGWMHGLGMALLEEAIYDPDGGFRSASFLEYLVPSPPEGAVDLRLISLSTPTPSNPEGIKGIGENATIPVPACIANAVENAIRQLNPMAAVTSIPITPDEVLAQLRA